MSSPRRAGEGGRLLSSTSVEDGRLDSLCGLGQSSLIELAFAVELGSRSIFFNQKLFTMVYVMIH